ncbi:MAG: metallophosphoesterase family protein, partial [Clostridia bacterium]|nr:metallophosphoesterase family protein [Clostridia bacterium]
MKICLLCDLHLPYHTESIQYDVLRWAMDDLQKKHADALVVPGDFTIHGDIPQAEAFLKATGALSIPVVICTGNSEYRNPDTKEYFRRLAAPSVNDIGNGWKVIALHDGEGRLTDEDYAALDAADDHCIVALHHPFHSLPSPHREKLTEWRENHPHVPVFCGHLHYTRDDGDTHMLTAADPDKVAGEHPCIAYYDTETKTIEKSYYFCPVPAGFLQHIGISCYNPAVDIPYAAENHIGCIELRPGAVGMDPDVLDKLLQNWRNHGGNCLSLHGPDLADKVGNLTSAAVWESFIAFANRIHANRITVHTPRVHLSVLAEKP